MSTWLIVLLIIGVILMIAVGGIIYYCSKNDHPTHKLGGMLTFGVPLLGQIISRFAFVSGDKKFDKWWLLVPIFWVPPFSIIPAYLIYNDMEYC
jgi:hypothetical protein